MVAVFDDGMCNWWKKLEESKERVTRSGRGYGVRFARAGVLEPLVSYGGTGFLGRSISRKKTLGGVCNGGKVLGENT